MVNEQKKVVLVSGGLGDIGRAIAMQFALEGMRVAISDLPSEEEANGRLEEMRQGGGEISYTRVDSTSELEVTNWIDRVEEEWGTPQVVVPNAGIVVAGSLTSDDFTSAQIRTQMDVNFWGSYHLAVIAAKRMKAKGLPGRITLIGSWAAERPNARISSYCISKAAVRMLC
ncbi:MAG TPA: SDR family oxidoreductase, partial [Flavisolibacter sp.]|nr:SDR family oxidoreductase [Flavisolibacter sp.]